MPAKCGRKHLDGNNIPPQLSCSDFKKPYSESILDELQDSQVPYSTIVEIIQELDHSIKEDTSDELAHTCTKAGYIDLKVAQQRILKGVNAAVLASKGTLLSSD